MKLFVVFIVFGVTIADIHRSKRFLIFPPTSPTRMQIIAGIGVPVQLEYESVTFGYTFKAEYFLQDNMTISNHFLQDPFNPIPHPISNRRRRHAQLVASNELKPTHDPIELETNKLENKFTTNEHYEKYDVEAIEIDAGLSGVDADEEDEEYYADDGTDENMDVHDNENDDDEHDEDESYPTSNKLNAHPKDLSTARWTLFKGIEMLAQKLVKIF